MSVPERTHYDVLAAEPSAPKADLKAAYVAALEAAQAAGDSDEVAAVRRAWQVLSDPVQRQRYDEQMGLTARSAAASTERDQPDDDDVGDAEVIDDEMVDDTTPTMVDQLRERFPNVPEYLEQPTLGRRVTASLIDVVTTLAVFSATSAIAIAALSGDGARLAALIGLFEVWVIALFVVPTYRTGQTLGKRLTYIMTVDRDTGNLPSAPQVIRRYAVPMIAVPVLLQMGPFLALFFGLSYLMARDQLSLADRLAKTIVVVARYQPTRGEAGA